MPDQTGALRGYNYSNIDDWLATIQKTAAFSGNQVSYGRPGRQQFIGIVSGEADDGGIPPVDLTFGQLGITTLENFILA